MNSELPLVALPSPLPAGLYPSFYINTYVVPRAFAVVLHTCMYCTLVRLAPSVALSLLLLPLAPFNSFSGFVILSSNTDTMYFDILHSHHLIPPFTPDSPVTTFTL
jgi:hypothetical protein